MQYANEIISQTEGGSLMDFSYQAEDNEKDDSINESTGNHTASLIKAATPYFDPDTQKSLHFIAAVYEVMDTVQLFKQKKTVSALSFSMKNVDIEALLKGIRPVCNSQEKPLIDKFLNIFSMRRMFETYQNLSSMMSMFNSEASNSEPFMRQESYDATSTPPNSEDLNYYNDSNIVDDFDYNNNPSTTYQEPRADYLEAAQLYNDFEKQQYKKQPEEKQHEEKVSEEKQANTSSPNNNQQMMEMLGSILTPEQKTTFDAMKMIFDSGMLNM